MKKYFIWLLPLAVAAFIFYFSSQPADESSALSNGIVKKIVDILSAVNPNIDSQMLLEWLATPVRKTAHICEFLLLDLTLLVAWRVSGLHGTKMIGSAFLMVFLYACTDEFHQIFVSGRAGRFIDVLIDCSGVAILAVFLLIWQSHLGKKR